MKLTNTLKLSAIALGLSISATPLVATASSTPVVSSNITKEEVIAAQKAWGDALVKISATYEEKGISKAKKLASGIIDDAYAYDIGPVLFKPTLAPLPVNIRTTKEGALSYFVGDNEKFPSDGGFALKGWKAVESKNAAIQLHGKTAMTIGNVMFTDSTGKVTTVDKTWGYLKDDKGNVRIVLHHSSLPYSAN